jgi:predicted MFS family arabinose efflux permease
MILAYSLVGVGTSMVGPMTMALAGDRLPRMERSRAVGWLLSGNSLSYLIGAPVIAYLAGIGSWRTAFLFWVLPVTLVGILSIIFGLPSLRDKTPQGANVDIVASFKAVFTNRSALSCLVGSALLMASVQAILVYGASFYRQQFLVSRSSASLFVIGDAIFFTVGSVGSARLVNRYGCKPVIVITGLIGGLFVSAYTLLPILWVSAAARFLCMLFIGFSLSALNSLILEQVSENRGTLMSINSAITSIGSSLGSFIGGLMLLMYGYTLVGVSLGAMAVASAIIIHFLAVDPNQ